MADEPEIRTTDVSESHNSTPPADFDDEDDGLNEEDWIKLLTAIRLGRCTPFLGAGASIPHIRSAVQIAQDWAAAQKFPFPNGSDLIRVAQYLSVRFGPMFPKGHMIAECDVPRPVFQTNSIYDVLSDLDLPIFVTTNYDSLMTYALESKGKQPEREICRWQPDLRNDLQSFLASGYRPTVAKPLVFHFHGHYSHLDSLVLDEDDYLEFLKDVSSNQDVIPPQIQSALRRGLVLFLGYSLSDWTIQVVLRTISQYLSRAAQQSHLSVQLVPQLGERPSREQSAHAREYLSRYFGRQNVSVYWGSCERFAQELRRRLRQ